MLRGSLLAAVSECLGQVELFKPQARPRSPRKVEEVECGAKEERC